MRSRAAIVLVLGAMSGCSPEPEADVRGPAAVSAGLAARSGEPSGGADDGEGTAGSTLGRPIHVDSARSIEEELGRFRAGLDAPGGLRHGAAGRDELVARFVRALEEADTAGLAALAIDRAEFAWHYYPHTMYVRPPYELPPGLVWFQLRNRSSGGMARILRSHGGKRLYVEGHRCPDDGEAFGGGHIWHGCTLFGQIPRGESVEERLFGSILELDGRYKLVSYSNGR